MFCLLCSSLYVYINILSYCSRLLVGWQRDIHEFDLEPRQCYVRSTKTLTKPFTCWSKGYSCNFANQVSHSFFLVRWEKRIEHLACEDAILMLSLYFILAYKLFSLPLIATESTHCSCRSEYSFLISDVTVYILEYWNTNRVVCLC